MIAIITEEIPARQARASLLGEEPGEPPSCQPAPKSPYFKMDKALCDALLRSLSGVELKVALVVERWSTGHYNHPSAQISVSLLLERTGCSKTALLQARRRLLEEGVLEEVIPHTNRRGSYLRVTRDPARWGAFSAPQRQHLRLAGGQETAPQGSTNCTSSGQETAPLEVRKDDPLNGLKIEKELSERGQPAGDDQGSPPSGLDIMYEGLKDAPEFVKAGLRRRSAPEKPRPRPG